jgi:hypothetical protein
LPKGKKAAKKSTKKPAKKEAKDKAIKFKTSPGLKK